MAGVRIVLARSEVAMIEFFLTTLRFARGAGSAWRRDPQFRSLVFLVVITLLGWTIFYTLEEGWSVVDAFYFSVTTLTTVGFGDLAPATTFGKLFMVVYIFAGLGLIVGFINAVAQETLSHQSSRGRSSSEGDEDAYGG
jgi:voltage-gated potassium channel